MTLTEAVESMKNRFTSGNCIPVERAIITADHWSVIGRDLTLCPSDEDNQLNETVSHFNTIFSTDHEPLVSQTTILKSQWDIIARNLRSQDKWSLLK